MATGDILSARIRPDGWTLELLVQGFLPGVTLDWGSLAYLPATLVDPPVAVDVTTITHTALGVPTTAVRRVYGTTYVRLPYSTSTIAGAFTAGTFADDEIVTQAGTGATAIVVGNQSAGPSLRIKCASTAPAPDAAGVWTGASGSFTPSAAPVALSELSPDVLFDGANLRILVALNEQVYSEERNGGGGTSGTDPVVSIAAGWATNTGGLMQTTPAVVDLAVTNDSAIASPPLIMQWDPYTTPIWELINTDFEAAVIVQHGFGVRTVYIEAVGTVSGHVVSGYVTSRTKRTPTASGISYGSYGLPIAHAGFAQGDEIILNARGYSRRGALVFDTSTNVLAADRIRGMTPISVTCDKTDAIKASAIAVVADGGSDTTGALGAAGTLAAAITAAAATPYATAGRALQAGAVWVLHRAGTRDFLGSTPTSVPVVNYCREIRPYPGETVTLTRGATYRQYKTHRLLVRGIQSITTTVNNAYLDGNNADVSLLFRDCGFNTLVEQGNTPSIGYRSMGCWVINCTESHRSKYNDYSTGRVGYCLVGNRFDAPAFVQAYTAVANRINGGNVADATRIAQKGTANPAPVAENVLILNNLLTNVSINSSPALIFGDAELSLKHTAIIGNLLEVRSIGSAAAAGTCFDGSTGDADNVIIAHMGVFGQRWNAMYHDANAVPMKHLNNIFFAYNDAHNLNIKGHNFNHPTYHQDGRRIGNFAQMHGVNYRNNIWDGTASPSFVPHYYGVGVRYVDDEAVVFGQLGLTNDASNYGTGLGGGDYTPTESSPLTGHVVETVYEDWDLFGTPITSSIGPVQRASSAVSHAASGALTGDAAQLSGTAARTRVHTATGSLAAASAVISGAASRTRAHAAAGTLAGAVGAIVGAASRIGAAVVHAATGSLSGAGSAIAGAASRASAATNDRAEMILDAVKTRLTGLTTTGQHVIRGQVYPTDESASLAVMMGGSQVITEGIASVDELLEVIVTAQVKALEGASDTALNTIHKEVYAAMLADRTLGLAFVKNVRWLGRGAPQSEAAEEAIAWQELRYGIHYRHSQNSTEA